VTASSLGVHEFQPRLQDAASRWRRGTEVIDVLPLHGASSLTFKAGLRTPAGLQEVIAKVAPPGVEPTRNRDVLRQAAALRHLHGHPRVRTPGVLFEEPGAGLDEPPFFVMEFLHGDCVEPILDDPLDEMPDPAVVRARSLDAAVVLAALHGVGTEAPAFRDERPYSLEREVERWTRALSTVDAELRVDADLVADLLRTTVPEPMAPTLLHGDFRLGNLLCDDEGVVGVVDWEIWSLGDPRIDLLWFLLFTSPERLPVAVREAPGMPSVDELVAAYVDASPHHELAALTWFDALIQFKQAAVTALIVKHNRRREHPDPRLERSARQIAPLMARAASLLR
jgi:aminoglycoside phosphotransferase (APT) family kinase protein